ncbi:MAG TPA: family 1 glycosylhydrolase, partial [bacterium]|nr:family 1 glycosylhydrolase [bacterium]
RTESRAQIGLVLNLEPKVPATDSEEDRRACARSDASMNRQYLEPVLLGRWPKEMREIYGEAWPADMDECLPEIREPIDYLGVNYYKRGVTRHDPAAPPIFASEVFQESSTYTEMNWEVHAESLKQLLLWVRERSGDLPIYVTENGAAFYDPPRAIAEPHPDPLRIQYLRDHIRAVHAAREAGANVRGYFVWSLMDNVEWSVGTTKRFGLVHVDFATQRRTHKSSALFYRDVIRTSGASMDRDG